VKIILTRAKEDCKHLRKLVDARLKIESIDFPCIEIAPPKEGFALLDEAIRQNHMYDWVFFLSPKAADSFFGRLIELGGHFFHLSPRLKIAAIGRSTADYIREEIGFPVDFVPEQFNSNNFAKEFRSQFVDSTSLTKLQVILPRTEIADDLLIQSFENSLDIFSVPAYDTVLPICSEQATSNLLELFDSNQDLFLTFASSQTVRNFFHLTNQLDLNKYPKTKLFSIGPKTTQSILEIYGEGLQLIEARESSFDSIIDAIENSMVLSH
jgi:uroporphyrinogen-III synthase